MALKVVAEQGNPKKYVLHGAINEDADLNDLFANVKGDIVVSFAHVTSVNSVGIHRLFKFFNEYTKKHQVSLECLTYTLAIQASAIANLFGKAKITSTLAPYFCKACEKNSLLTVTQKDLQKWKGTPPAVECEHCGKKMEFDELPTYFNFMGSVRAS